MSSMDITVYTDGLCLNSGRGSRAVGGIGVYFGPYDYRNFSGRLPGKLQANQRAELEAIRRALLIVSDYLVVKGFSHRPRVCVKTDSQYSINCATVWVQKWVKNGWLNNKHMRVLNLDLIQDILVLMRICDGNVVFQYIPGHSKVPGNQAAHTLATNGARS
ncbi:hypothetical protein GGI02_003656 [Coemansia sp. RSA 2322]|uniref:ribonuclease H n=1 Tax=Coemansia thaxteri TaxID=2663907 RepID=A0A9W8EIS0_9FUNG|nr:hypothetical protein H4R26_002097 [Coemansia thaxteri]KAJ2468589.1 hypothetical protein GGI02_003656 [Coemansia sp. RSA 2322]KAJ2479123.1 hypothetical protein EV174_004106 [Coemansia sp. RSA 2320]